MKKKHGQLFSNERAYPRARHVSLIDILCFPISDASFFYRLIRILLLHGSVLRSLFRCQHAVSHRKNCLFSAFVFERFAIPLSVVVKKF